MTVSHRTLTAALLLTATTALAQDRPSGPTSVPKPYGPSWIGSSRPGGSSRPENIPRNVTAVGVGDHGPLGVQVWFWGDVADLKTGNTYELRYQIRVHTKPGEVTPLLGTTARPEGVAPVVASATATDDWNGLEGNVDVTRKELTSATNLPKPSRGKASHVVMLRVEPQLYDVTAGKYLTPPKTPALVLAARVWENGNVGEVLTLGEWVAMNRGKTCDDMLARVATLDDYDPTASGLERGICQVLQMSDVPAATKAKFIAALPAERVRWKENFNLMRLLEAFAGGDDATLKAAAAKKLAEAK